MCCWIFLFSGATGNGASGGLNVSSTIVPPQKTPWGRFLQFLWFCNVGGSSNPHKLFGRHHTLNWAQVGPWSGSGTSVYKYVFVFGLHLPGIVPLAFSFCLVRPDLKLLRPDAFCTVLPRKLQSPIETWVVGCFPALTASENCPKCIFGTHNAFLVPKMHRGYSKCIVGTIFPQNPKLKLKNINWFISVTFFRHIYLYQNYQKWSDNPRGLAFTPGFVIKSEGYK